MKNITVVTPYTTIAVRSEKALTTITDWFKLNRTHFIVVDSDGQAIQPNYVSELEQTELLARL